MNRSYTVNDFKSCVKKLTDCNPQFEIITDILVGFPSETERDFLDTMKLVEWLGSYKVYFQCLSYSKRPNTKASKMSGQIDQKIKKDRLKKVAILCRADQIIKKLKNR